MTDNKISKNTIYISCEICNFTTSKKTDYSRHLSTVKHKKNTGTYQILTNTYENSQQTPHQMPPQIIANAQKFECECGKTYKHKQSLYNHCKKCTNQPNNIKVMSSTINEQLILELINQNKTLQEIIKQKDDNTVAFLQNTIIEMMPKVGNITNNTNNTVHNNINVSVFLNDNCKDALSMKEFIETIEIDVEDLMYTGKKGLANGLAKLFIEQFNKLPLAKRPLWCSDKKRHTLYIKQDEWTEDKDNEKTKEAIKTMGYIQAKNTSKYVNENPDWLKKDSTKDAYMQIVKQTTSDVTEHFDKVISILSDNTHLTSNAREKIKNYDILI
jgi:hypothetical protein